MKRIVCIGGTNVDLFLKPNQRLILRDSNPGHMHMSYGGVGRNVAENLARLSFNPFFLTVIGRDEHGKTIIEACQKVGILMDVIYVNKTPMYVAILDEHSDMYVSIAVMEGFEALDRLQIERRKHIIDASDYLFIDTNMDEHAMAYVFENFEKPIFVDAISTTKALKLIPFLAKIFVLKVNLDEALALTSMKKTKNNELQIAKKLVTLGVKHVFLTLGASGAIYANSKDTIKSIFKPSALVNTTGAGDAFMAGVIYAFSNQKEPLSYGVAAANITVNAKEAVSDQMSLELLEQTVEALKQ